MTFTELSVRDALTAILRKESPKRILLVTGRMSFDLLYAADTFSDLARRYHVVRFSDFSTNPQYDDLVRAADAIHSERHDLIVAVGGGSVIDFAKLLSLFIENRAALAEDVQNVSRLAASAPIVAIPTTAGSGSEATHFAVLYRGGAKFSVASPQIKPAYAIIDSACTDTMDSRLTAVSGIDAICQAIESLWAKNATPESRLYAEAGLRLMLPSYRSAVVEPDREHRRDMACGAHYAGRAIDISKTTGAHAMSYHLTARYGVPHGEAVSIFLPLFMRLNAPRLDQGVRDLLCGLFDSGSLGEASARFVALQKEVGLRTTIREVGISTGEALNALVDSVNEERLLNNPGSLSREEIRSALEDQDDRHA